MNSNINDIEIKEIVDAILGVVPALEIYVFGSYANGKVNEDSDYDFYVVVPDDFQPTQVAWKIQAAIKNRVRGIDMMVGRKSKFDKYKHVYSIENEVLESGVKLYG